MNNRPIILHRLGYLSLYAILILLASGTAAGQQFILLEHTNNHKQVTYYVGETIHVKTLKRKHIKGIVKQISDSIIEIGMEKVHLAEVGEVFTQRWLLSLLSAGSTTAGAGYFFLESFNNIINKEKTIIEKREILISAILFGSGFVLGLFDERKCSIQRKWRLKVIDFNELENTVPN